MREDRIGPPRVRLSSRRVFLSQLACTSLATSALPSNALALLAPPLQEYVEPAQETQPAVLPPPSSLTPQDDQFLNDLEQANFLFFYEQTNPTTGLTKDRCNVRANDTSTAASIASTGFGLTAICIALKRGFIQFPEARLRVVRALSFIWHKLPTHHGFYFHFADINTGERIFESEVSSVDTAILLCGVLMCRQCFQDHDIDEMAHAIFDRVDWTWIAEDTSLLSMGWTPELGFINSRWSHYSELMMMYLLGMGSSSHPLDKSTWFAWTRTFFEYDGLRYIGAFAPLFVHQYSQAWFDFRDKRDQYADYFQNSLIATDAHRIFCLELHSQWSDYGNDLWGITASDSKSGYVVWGGPPAMGPIDGTIVPCAAGGSIPFLPADTMRVLHNIHDHYPNAWGRYGFVDAFNPLTGWYDTDVVGIDTGITMLMAENARTGYVWEMFMKNPEAQRGMQMAGFSPYTPAAPTPGAAQENVAPGPPVKPPVNH
ncbi:MAG TPA: glucoamylase family protein [Terracidiphilus sp.]|nr:glucoamylase family protein [Terracidiphilus sp.]